MAYNKCNYCGAGEGRAGILFSIESEEIVNACENCKDTLVNNEVTIHMNLRRTEEELEKTMNLLSE